MIHIIQNYILIFICIIAAKPIPDNNELIHTVVFSTIPLVAVASMFLFVYWVYKRRKIPQFSHVSELNYVDNFNLYKFFLYILYIILFYIPKYSKKMVQIV